MHQEELGFLKEMKLQCYEQRLAQIEAGWNTNQRWCNPEDYTDIAGVDFGEGRVHVHLLRAQQNFDWSLENAKANFSSLPKGTLIVVEKAHLGTPQTKKSLAQPYTAEQLLEIYQDCNQKGISIRLFPHAHTTKARRWAHKYSGGLVEYDKESDANDAAALAFFVENNNGISLAKPAKTFDIDNRRAFGKLVRQASNQTLNVLRRHDYDLSVFPEISKIADAITGNNFVNQKVACSILSHLCFYDGDQCLRFTYKGRTVGKNFWQKYILMCSPFHHGGGVARSNIYWHRFRHFLVDFAKLQQVTLKQAAKHVPFYEHDPAENALRAAAHRQARIEMKQAYDAAKQIAMMFEGREILEGNAP